MRVAFWVGGEKRSRGGNDDLTVESRSSKGLRANKLSTDTKLYAG